MRASLAVGLDIAKGLAVAWGVPLVGVHHMLGHALTVRLVDALRHGEANRGVQPRFPFWSLLVSGGHTIIVWSESVVRHSVMAETVDVAVGDMLDKASRAIVPAVSSLPTQGGSKGVVYGRLLEEFAFPPQEDGGYDGYEYAYHPPRTPAREQQDALLRKKYPSWYPIPAPFMSTGSKHNFLAFSFAGIGSSVEKALRMAEGRMEEQESRHLARQTMQCAFEHVAKRIVLAFREWERGLPWEAEEGGSTIKKRKQVLVLSGGVASNSFLRHVLKTYLANQLESVQVELICPPPAMCTDNAAMIAWAGLEMWEGGVDLTPGGGNHDIKDSDGLKDEGGWCTNLSCHPVRKWSLNCPEEPAKIVEGDPGEEHVKGILGVDGWVERRRWEGDRAKREAQEGSCKRGDCAVHTF